MLDVFDRMRAVAGRTLITLFGVMVLLGAAHAQEKITVTDLAGREVEVPKGAKKVILGEGRMFYATVMLDKDKPFEQLAAIGDDLREVRSRHLGQVSGALSRGQGRAADRCAAPADFSVEKALAARRRRAGVTLGFYDKIRESGIIDKLDKAGVPTVFVDFRERPTQNTVPSMLLLGRIFGKEAQAQAFVDFYMQQMRRVYNVTSQAEATSSPLVFAEQAAGLDPLVCCRTFGNFNFGEFVAEAGGLNLGLEVLLRRRREVNPEKIIVDDPAYLLVTGANWSQSNPGNKAVWLGYETEEKAQGTAPRPDRSGRAFPRLTAVKDGNVMAVYHQFYQSPYHFVAVQALAKWLHPEEFADLDPQATFQELHEKFLPITVSGVFWTR